MSATRGYNLMDIWSKYDLTAARPHSLTRKSARWPVTPTVDIHSHVAVQSAAEFARPHLKTRPFQAQVETVALGRKQEGDRRSRLGGYSERIGELDQMGIDVQIIMPTPNQCYHDLPAEIASEAVRMVNDGIGEFASHHPQRFMPFGTVPLPDAHAAAEELARISELGFRGVEILTNIGGREISDPAFDPFWAKAEALRMLVVIHPAGYTEPDRLTRFYFNNVIGNPLDTTVALHHLIFDGVLERFPELLVLAVHGGGYLPAYHGRIDHAWGARSDAHGSLPKPPSHYLRKVYFDTVVFTNSQLEYLVRVFGADRLLMGTDYPYDMAEYAPVEHVASSEMLDERQIASITGGNALRLLGAA
jgi:aminocarboxymuconate-semialdehyde decarboxylase